MSNPKTDAAPHHALDGSVETGRASDATERDIDIEKVSADLEKLGFKVVARDDVAKAHNLALPYLTLLANLEMRTKAAIDHIDLIDGTPELLDNLAHVAAALERVVDMLADGRLILLAIEPETLH